MSVHVRGPGAHGPAVAEAVREVHAELRRVDARFSTYRADSEVSRYRAGGVARPSALLAEVLHLCALARDATGGAFDAALPGGFDPSGLVKGWAVERASRALAGLDADDWLINAGGDVLVRAHAGRTWAVGVEDPDAPQRVLRVVHLASGAVATSGTAHRGAHVVDPRTGRPAGPQVRSATVVGPSLLWADVYATAAVVKGAEAATWLADLPGHRGFVVTSGLAPGGAAGGVQSRFRGVLGSLDP